MVVGRELTGKTSITRVLQEAVSRYAEEDVNSGEMKVESHVINPKSILHNQLYG
jgi:hypothetical protein